MKNLITSLGLFALMLVSIYFINNYLHYINLHLIEATDKIDKLVDDNQWEEAIKETDDLIEHWQKHLKFVTFFVNHNDTDAITYEMVKLKGYMKNYVKEECSPSLESIKMLFMKVIHQEELSFQGIF
ncbi:DUF4363 family protein [Clostridium cellulovorans]|uniref:DUF4363 domain-containing protein n=1 Tax=Clostridium cellulovorans (strain ATCC 35296 / DSM 3052 / OCM 3 / 743B) TaxID=573061 RepID=D9SRU1_CLOC7|nr:DUF4363 family protein [Clostridium cellulovorans]ADL50458.1 hypothetical protein Clocel_0687 [Clostridium cellulovorans 743B]